MYVSERKGDALIVTFDKRPSSWMRKTLLSYGGKPYGLRWYFRENADVISLQLREWAAGFRPHKQPTICWACKKSGFGNVSVCPWEREFKPVPGWAAERSDILSYKDNGVPKIMESYCVMDCPLFVPEPRRKKLHSRV